MQLLPLSSNSRIREENSGALLFLNVYDITPINNYAYWFGLGIFHSGIEVHGLEYGFGAHEYPTSGVFEVEPRNYPGFTFRRSVLLGSTSMSRSEFRSFMEKISRKYHGDTYHLIVKNCNHFTDEVSTQLTGQNIPGWVNRMARLGSFCNCLLPESIQATTVGHIPDNLEHTDDGSESYASSSSSSLTDENIDDCLLSTQGSNVAFVQDERVNLTRQHSS